MLSLNVGLNEGKLLELSRRLEMEACLLHMITLFIAKINSIYNLSNENIIFGHGSRCVVVWVISCACRKYPNG